MDSPAKWAYVNDVGESNANQLAAELQSIVDQ